MRKSFSVFCILSAMAISAGCNDNTSSPNNIVKENTPELCADETDNDHNGATDCDDEGCQELDVCQDAPNDQDEPNVQDEPNDQTPHEEMCVVVKECEDGPCEVQEPCVDDDVPEIENTKLENTDELCSDKQDNDENGKTDCDDPSCRVLEICAGWETAENTPESCSDGKDNDGDFETDCEDVDCKEYCDDSKDPGWTVEGKSCKASELGMIPDETDNVIRGKNYIALKKAIENEESDRCTNIEIDGIYHLMPVDKAGESTGKSGRYIKLSHMIKLTGGYLELGAQRWGFRLMAGGGMVAENMKFTSTNTHSSNSLIDAYEYVNRYHGTAERIMFKNCEFDLNYLFLIKGVNRYYTEETKGGGNHYAIGDIIKKEEIPELSTRIKRITVKDSKGTAAGNITDMGVLERFEILNNEFFMPCKKVCLSFFWSSTNEFQWHTEINFQGNSHVIIRGNKITGPDDLIVNDYAYYPTPFLIESRTANYEDNHIENLMVRRSVELDEKTGEPVQYMNYLKEKETNTKASYSLSTPPTYDSYLSCTQVIARHNTIKNVIPVGSHYRTNTYYNELIKFKACPNDGSVRVRRYENNTYILEESVIDSILNRMMDGGTFKDGTEVDPMYVMDGNSKRKLNEEERAAYIKSNKTWNTNIGTSLYDMNEITISHNTFEMEGLYLIGAYIFFTRNFTANGNTVKLRSILHEPRGTINLFEVSPYKYGNNQATAKKTKNASLHSNVEVKNNTLILSEQIPPNKSLKIPENSFPLLEIMQSADAAYVDQDGVSHPVPFELGKVEFSGNICSSGLELVMCQGKQYWNVQCSGNE